MDSILGILTTIKSGTEMNTIESHLSALRAQGILRWMPWVGTEYGNTRLLAVGEFLL